MSSFDTCSLLASEQGLAGRRCAGRRSNNEMQRTSHGQNGGSPLISVLDGLLEVREMARRGLASKTFGSKFEAALKRFSVEFLESAAFKDAATKGSERELPVQDFLRAHLPGAFSVQRGEVVDRFDNHSQQLDIMLFNSARNYAFLTGASALLPAEALLASVEVKSRLSKAELERAVQSAVVLRKLKPFGERSAKPKRDGAHRDYKCRYFHCLFAYGTDLAHSDWPASEARRLKDVTAALGAEPGVIDRVYVAGKGFLNLASSVAILEEGDKGIALMQFYLHLLNFVLREDASRKPVPVMDYAGGSANRWRKI